MNVTQHEAWSRRNLIRAVKLNGTTVLWLMVKYGTGQREHMRQSRQIVFHVVE